MAESGGAPADPDAGKPLPDRLKSKSPISRANALADVAKMCAESDVSAPIFKDMIDKWKTILADSHPLALERAQESLAAFINKVQPSLLIPYQPTIVKVLIEKGLTNAKKPIKEKALENILLMFEVSETFDEDAITALQDMCKHKNVKVKFLISRILTTLFC